MRRLVALLLVLVTVVACSGGDDHDAPDDGDTAPTTGTTQPPVDGGRLVVGLEGPVDGLDPSAAPFSPSELSAAVGVFDPLLAVRSDGEVVPYLASSFEGSDDHTRWTITLREGITFSDGTPLDAAAVISMLDRFLSSTAMQPALRPLRSFSALGTMALELTSEPWPELPMLLTGQLGLIASPTMVDALRPIGTGAFTVAEIVPARAVVLVRRTDHWRSTEDVPRLDEVELRTVADSGDRIALLKRGDLDVIHVSGARSIGALRDEEVVVAEPASTDRAVVVLVDPDEVACAEAVGGDGECDEDVAFTVETDQPDDVVEQVVADWQDAGFDVSVERVDRATLVTDRLLGDVAVLLTVDDGLLPVSRLDGSPFVRVVIEPIAWAYGAGAKAGGMLGSLPLPDGDGETRATPGVVVPAALHRTR